MAQPAGNDKVYPKLGAMDLGSAATPTNALLNLLRRDPESIGADAARPKINVNRFTLDKVSRKTSQEIIDSDSIMQLLPDLELVETVMVGSILSPKDLADTDLLFTVDAALFDSEISRLLLEPVETYFKKDYKINDRLDLILRDMLFRKGASVLAVLPENVLDNLINGKRNVSMETFSTVRDKIGKGGPLGFLGHPSDTTVSLEGYADAESVSRIKGDKHLTVTDNFEVLKIPTMSRRVREIAIARKLHGHHVSLEDNIKQFNSDEINKLYENRTGVTEHTQVVTPPRYMERQSVGHPLILPLPVESVVPVYIQGRPHEHVGYFLLVDQQGYPISKDGTRDFYNELQAGWKNKGNGDTSEIIRLTREAMGGNDQRGDFEINEIQNTYNSIIVNDLNNRLRNGMYDQEVELGLTEEIQRIMLYRSWKAKRTQLVFIPAELMVYMAFDFNNDGVGETLLSRSKMIATMRSTLLMAETVGGMRNAVGRKRVRITLDPDDPDPEQTISNVQSTIMETAMRSFPLAAPDPAQAMDSLVRSGFDFAVETNGADYAETKVEYDDYNTNVQAGNQEMQDRLRRMHISGLGVPPEKVDPMSSPDFATSAVQNDLVMSRRVKEKQKAFCNDLGKLVRVFTTHSSQLRAHLAKLVADNVTMITAPELKGLTVNEVVDEFIEAIRVSLPAPDNTQHQRQSEAMEEFNRLLDMGLEAYVTQDLFPDEVLAVPGLADTILAQVRAVFRRQFMAENNILPELNALTEMQDDKPTFNLLDFAGLQQETMGRAFLEYAKSTKKTKEKFAEEFKSVIDADSDGFDESTPSSGDDAFGESEPDDLSLDAPETNEEPATDSDEPLDEEPVETL